MNKKRSGYTLIELLIVVAIIAVLVGVGFNYYQDSLEDAKINTVKMNLNAVRDAIARYFKDRMVYPASLDQLHGPYLQNTVEELVLRPLQTIDPSAKIELLGTTTVGIVNIYPYGFTDADNDHYGDPGVSQLDWIDSSLGTCTQFRKIRVKYGGTYLE
ncbi:MAG: hypothetical protein Kow0029_14400 [Candidatus Rifleibacteriota bacterium]